MGDKLSWILMGGGAAIVLVSCWCRVLLDIPRLWFIVAIVLGLGMIVFGKVLQSRHKDGKNE